MKRLAKLIRILTVPTLVFSVLILLTLIFKPEPYTSAASVWVTLLFDGFFPVFAYAAAFLIRRLKRQSTDDNRILQRKLAFIFSIIGYTAAFVISIICGFSARILRITASYFFTVCILTALNLCKIKASGHAAGIVGPMLHACAFFGRIAAIPCTLLTVASFWASVYLKRHTVKQYLLGSLCAIVSFIAVLLIF